HFSHRHGVQSPLSQGWINCVMGGGVAMLRVRLLCVCVCVRACVCACLAAQRPAALQVAVILGQTRATAEPGFEPELYPGRLAVGDGRVEAHVVTLDAENGGEGGLGSR